MAKAKDTVVAELVTDDPRFKDLADFNKEISEKFFKSEKEVKDLKKKAAELETALANANDENNKLSEEIVFYKRQYDDLQASIKNRVEPNYQERIEHFANLATVYRNALIQIAKEVN